MSKPAPVIKNAELIKRDIEILYLAGSCTLKELATKYKITKSQICVLADKTVNDIIERNKFRNGKTVLDARLPC